jgi:hypothetical protein
MATWEECLPVERSGRQPRYKVETSDIKSASGQPADLRAGIDLLAPAPFGLSA